MRVELLRAGDRVKTLDQGLLCICWIGSKRVSGCGIHAPVRIGALALGNALALWLSQQHRMLLLGWKLELHSGEAEMLITG